MSASARFARLGLVLAALAATPAVANDPAATEFELRRLRGPRADVAALMLGGRESGSLRVAARAAAGCPLEGAAAPVDLQLEVEAASLLAAVESAAGDELPQSVRLELYAYALGRTGGPRR